MSMRALVDEVWSDGVGMVLVYVCIGLGRGVVWAKRFALATSMAKNNERETCNSKVDGGRIEEAAEGIRALI